MARVDLASVHEGNDLLVFKHDGGGDFSADDAGKDGIGHHGMRVGKPKRPFCPELSPA
jgi:hypothetical protein